MLPLDEHLREADLLTPRQRWTGGDFKSWQQRTRQSLKKMLGEVPYLQRPVHVERIWSHQTDLGTIQKFVLHMDGMSDLPMYWCLPSKFQSPLPVFICLQGHTTGMHLSIGVDASDEQTPIAVPNDRDFALGCLRRGMAALCIEQRGFGARRDNPKNTFDCMHMSMRALMLGRTLLAERIADIQLACRWAAAQPETDRRRICALGNSAGGTAALYAAAVLDDILLAVPSCSFGRLRDTWFNAIQPRCVCGYVPGIAQEMDVPDVLALHAPKPVVVVGGENDFHCPGKPLREAFADLQARYTAVGAQDACKLVVGPEGHRFYADLAWPVILETLNREPH